MIEHWNIVLAVIVSLFWVTMCPLRYDPSIDPRRKVCINMRFEDFMVTMTEANIDPNMLVLVKDDDGIPQPITQVSYGWYLDDNDDPPEFTTDKELAAEYDGTLAIIIE